MNCVHPLIHRSGVGDERGNAFVLSIYELFNLIKQRNNNKIEIACFSQPLVSLHVVFLQIKQSTDGQATIKEKYQQRVGSSY